MSDEVTISVEDEVAWVTLNAPDRLNALSLAMVDDLAEALREGERLARVVVLQGAGRAFCAGANLAPESTGGPSAPSALHTHYNPLMRLIRGLAVPLITSIQGAAAGGGASLALAGDLVVAAEGAYFVHGFLKIGLVPDTGAAYSLARVIGRPRAMELLLLGDRLPAALAKEWGLVNRVVAPERLRDVTRDLARRLAAGPPRALSATRTMVWEAMDGTYEDELQREVIQQSDAVGSDEFLEGVAAFTEKRAPRF